ncbi:MAG: hypothetical protein KAT65_03100 [Methanophagales archaeon]|nr:hypothetical protein [Methanophagales archaeon]
MEEYAEWNESYVEWNFPAYPEFIIDEDEGFGTGFDTSYSEIKDVNVDLSRWMNITVFNSDAYQLAEFTITFREGDFMWCWGDIEVNEHHEVRASIVPNTFYTDAPLDWFDVEEDGVHFNFDKGQMQKDIPYNFTVVIKVELTGNEAPPIRYKPEFYIGQGIYYKDFTLAGKRHTAEMPEGMLPDNVSYASVITNVSNYWTLKRHNQIITVLGEVVELVGPHARFWLDKNFDVRTQDDSITSGTYDSNIRYWMGILNENDDSDTVLGNLTIATQAENIRAVDWGEYAKWNESYAEWGFPPEFIIEENEDFGTNFRTNFSESKYFNLNITRWFNQTSFNETAYQLVNFSLELEDKNFEWVWCHINANEHDEVYASIVPGTFETNAPINWVDEQEHRIQFDFDKDALQSGVTYNFSMVIKVEPRRPVIYKPSLEIGQGLYYNSTTTSGHTAEMPSYMLPENVSYTSVSTNIHNAWKLERQNTLYAELGEVVTLTGPHAEFEFNKDFCIRTENDTITSGTYESNISHWMGIHNKDDTSDTALGNLNFSAQVDNITGVDWSEYAWWNKSHVEWNFPQEFVVYENDGFGTGFGTSYTETKDVNVDLCRWMNITMFDSDSYQLARFNVTFMDKNFEWVWARIEANDHHETDASIVPGTFTYDAPLEDFDEWDHGVHFNFDENSIQPGVTYNFSVLVNVELTGKEAPPILYKPRFEIGEGLNHNSTTLQGYRYTAEMPFSMLPDNVSYASVMTNVSNAWLIKRHNHIITGLEEVSELAGPHALFSASKVFPVATENDTIHSGIYERNMWCRLNIKNSDDTSDTVLGDLRFNARTDNITYVNGEEHAVWNETSVSWTFPPDSVIYEDEWFGTGFGTNHTEVRHLNVDISRQINQTMFNDSAYQLANFTITFEDTDFQWCGCRIEANEHYEVNASIVLGTFYTDAPLDWFNEWEHGVDFGFDRDMIETGVAYNFLVVIKVDLTGNRAPPIVYKPLFFINVEREKSFAPGSEGFTAEMPPEMLPSYVNNASVTTNVSNNWTLRQVNRTIAMLKEVYGSTRIEAWIFDVYVNPLPTTPNVTFSGAHDNYKFVVNRLENPTSDDILSPSILLETRKPVMEYDYNEKGVKEFCYEFVAENTSNFNWPLHDISPHEGVETEVILNEIESVDRGYNAFVSVNKYEFSTPSEQTFNITVDVYDNSSTDIIWIDAWAKNTDFVSAEFVDWMSDIEPEDFGSEGAFWIFEKPENRTYTISLKLNVTPYSACVYRPGVEIFGLNITDELVSSSLCIVGTTWAGNHTISTGEPYDWVVHKGIAYVSSFEMIATENYTTIRGYVKDKNENPIENICVFVNIWNESKSEYQDYVETSTDESGYYHAYVKSNEKYKITAGWTRPDYTTEAIENITILPPTENFTLHNASVICGGVFDANKKPMQGVKIMVVDEFDIAVSSDFTNDDGYYRQLKIPEYGNYTVKVEGYDSNELELSDVGKGRAILHNFVVEPGSIVRIGYQPSTHQLAHMTAMEKGWWEEDLEIFGVEKVTDQEFPYGMPEMQAMLNGEIDIKATEYNINHQDAAAEIYTRKTGTDLEVVNYSLNTWDGVWVSDPYIGLNSTLGYAEIMYELVCVNKFLTKEDLFDLSFYEKITRERGVGKSVYQLFESFQGFSKEE